MVLEDGAPCLKNTLIIHGAAGGEHGTDMDWRTAISRRYFVYGGPARIAGPAKRWTASFSGTKRYVGAQEAFAGLRLESELARVCARRARHRPHANGGVLLPPPGASLNSRKGSFCHDKIDRRGSN